MRLNKYFYRNCSVIFSVITVLIFSEIFQYDTVLLITRFCYRGIDVVCVASF